MDINPSGIFGTNNTMPEISLVGATLQGTIKCTYEDLVHAFGEPLDEETDIAWLVMFNDYSVAKVYMTKTLLEVSPAQYWDIDGLNKTAFVNVSSAVQRSQQLAY